MQTSTKYLSTVLHFLENTSDEHKQQVKETYKGIEKGPLIEEENLDNKTDEVKHEDDEDHDNFITKHWIITVGDTHGHFTDSVCTY